MHYVNADELPGTVVDAPGVEGTTIQWLVDESHGAPTFSMRRFTVEPGGCTPLHEHPWEHEAYILAGRAEIVLDDGPVTVGPDTALLLAPNERHQFRSVGEEPLVFLCLVPNGPATQR